MNSIKILHCADIHLGFYENSIGVTAESRAAETLLTFEKIISTAKENNVDFLLISGDLFTSNNIEKNFIDSVFESFSKIPEINIIYAAGNHDPLNSDSPFKKHTIPKNVHVLDTKDCCVEFKDLNTRIYGRSFKEVYLKGEANFSIKPDDSFINIMCLHGELKSDLHSDYNSVTNNFIADSGMDYIALGHIHKRTEVQKINNTYFAYCGCPEGQGFDELGEKGIYLGTISKNDCQLNFVPVAKRMHICENVDVSDCFTSADVYSKIMGIIEQKYPNNPFENLYKIILTGFVEENADFSIPEISGRLLENLYFAKIKDKTQIKIDFNLIAKEPTLKGIFVKNMLNKIENAADQEKDNLIYALNLGIKAFNSEVTYYED